jgi:hypothetical protein
LLPGTGGRIFQALPTQTDMLPLYIRSLFK